MSFMSAAVLLMDMMTMIIDDSINNILPYVD